MQRLSDDRSSEESGAAESPAVTDFYANSLPSHVVIARTPDRVNHEEVAVGSDLAIARSVGQHHRPSDELNNGCGLCSESPPQPAEM